MKKEAKTYEKKVKIPEGIAVSLGKSSGNNILAVKGPKGELKKEVSNKVRIAIASDEVAIKTEGNRKASALAGTWEAHLKNMIIGVTSGWEAKLKAIYSHFPIKISLEKNKILIQNFLGERKARVATVYGDVKVNINKDEITVFGIDKEEVGQTAANIELEAKVTKRDRRVFSDGIWITQKCKPMQSAS